MNNPVCAVCGCVNRDGAVTCEACDARLNTTGREFGDEPPQGARASSDSTGEPSWAAPDTSEQHGAWSSPDDIPAPCFKTAGDVISPMLAVYRKHFMLVGALVLVTTVPEALLQFGFIGGMVARATAETGSGFNSLMPFAVAGSVVLWLITIACGALLSGALVYAVVDLQRAGRASAGACLSRGLKVLPKVLLVTILQSFITGFGFLLLIVPGVIFSLMFSVCVPAAVLERLGAVDALERSRRLTKGYKGLIFITYFLWGLLAFGLNWFISWSFSNSAEGFSPGLLPMLLIQMAVLGMVNSTLQVLTTYIYLGLLCEQRSGFQTNIFTPGPGVAAR